MCALEIVSRWAAPPASAVSPFLFEKVYVVHYTPRTWRRSRSLERLASVGVPVAKEDGVVAFVDWLDQRDLSERDLRCVRC